LCDGRAGSDVGSQFSQQHNTGNTNQTCYRFFEVAYASVKMGDAKVALIWARKTLEADLYSMKADWPECSELSDVIKKLERTVRATRRLMRMWLSGSKSPGHSLIALNYGCALWRSLA
jgi:hypothetical protein